ARPAPRWTRSRPHPPATTTDALTTHPNRRASARIQRLKNAGSSDRPGGWRVSTTSGAGTARVRRQMWVASTPPPPRYRPVAVVAALLTFVLGSATVPGPLGSVAGRHRPARLVEHTHVLDGTGTAQHLIPAPPRPAGDRGPGAAGPPLRALAPPGALPAPPSGRPAAPAAGDQAPPAAPGAAASAVPPVQPAAAALAALIDAHLADPRLAGTTVGLSVWADGLGEVARNGDAPLTPASNEKLFTAMGVLSLLPPTDTLVTEVRATGPVEGRVLAGDLALVGGG